MDWLDLLAVQGTLKSLLQQHSSKASILQHSAFFTVQLSHPYMTTGKTIALTRWTFVSKVMSLLFNMLSRLVITFLPKSKRLLISWLQSPSAVISEPKEVLFQDWLSDVLSSPVAITNMPPILIYPAHAGNIFKITMPKGHGFYPPADGSISQDSEKANWNIFWSHLFKSANSSKLSSDSESSKCTQL